MEQCEQLCHQSLAELDARFGSDQRLVVALSGGVDSCVLLALCHRYAPQRTRALHVNHGYAAASGDWQAHCEAICAELGVPLQVSVLNDPGGDFTEGRARKGRYRIFAEQLCGDEVLLLAHHLDDHAETLLLHLLQGRGTYAMPRSRSLGRGRLWRPLLELERAALVEYARRHDLRWLEDASNEDLRHDRNLLRHRLLPELAQRFSALPASLVQASRQLESLERLLIAQLGLDSVRLPLATLISQPLPEQLTIMRLWLAVNDIGQPAGKGLENFLLQLRQPEDRTPQLRVPGGSLRRYRGQVCFAPDVDADLSSRSVTGAGTVTVPQGQLTVTIDKAGVLPVGPLQLHFWRGSGVSTGHDVILCGGHHRRTKELLRSAGVEPWRRVGYPLLEDQLGLLCVPGIAMRDAVERGPGGYTFTWQAA